MGFETAFAVGYTYLVDKGHLTIGGLIEKMSCNPSGILGIDKGTLKAGASADIAVFDIENEYTVSAEKLYSKSKNTPYDGFALKGRLDCCIVNGEVVIG